MMFPRIVNAQYARLEHASDTARDLLSRLLVAKPGARLGICKIMSHPWFLKDLPKARPKPSCNEGETALSLSISTLDPCTTPARVPGFHAWLPGPEHTAAARLQDSLASASSQQHHAGLELLETVAGSSAACSPQGLVSRDPRRLAHADESAMVAYCEQSEDDIRALIARAQTRSQSQTLALARSGSGALMRSGSTPESGLALQGSASLRL